MGPRLKQDLHLLPTVQLAARPTRPQGKVGQPLPVCFGLRNMTSEKLDSVPSLDDSDGGRSPRYSVVVRDDKGVEQKPKAAWVCAHVNPLVKGDFVTLLPGEEFDPLGP